MRDLPLAFKYNISVHSCSWPPVELVFFRFEVLFCWIPVCNAFSFKLCYIKVQWSWICFYFSASQINILHLFANGRQKKKEWFMWVAVAWLAHERNKQEQINCFPFFVFLCFPSSSVVFFFSRVLNSSQSDGISTGEEHMLCQGFLSALPCEILEDRVLLQVFLCWHSWFPHDTWILTKRFSWKEKHEYGQLLKPIPA